MNRSVNQTLNMIHADLLLEAGCGGLRGDLQVGLRRCGAMVASPIELPKDE